MGDYFRQKTILREERRETRRLAAEEAENARLLKRAATLEATLEGLAELAELYEHSERVYQANLRRGFPKELARLANTVARYSAMRATTDLRNWLGFATLRCADNAQQEIRHYSNAAADALLEIFPRTADLFQEFRRGP
jgi:thymidylate synthase ThyX